MTPALETMLGAGPGAAAEAVGGGAMGTGANKLQQTLQPQPLKPQQQSPSRQPGPRNPTTAVLVALVTPALETMLGDGPGAAVEAVGGGRWGQELSNNNYLSLAKYFMRTSPLIYSLAIIKKIRCTIGTHLYAISSKL